MIDRPLAASEVLLLHQLTRDPDTVDVQPLITWRLGREGLLTTDQDGLAITDRGWDALAKALASRPRLHPDTIQALGAIDRAGRGGLIGRWPGSPHAWQVAGLFGLIRCLPPDATPLQTATWQLTEAGVRELELLRAARRAASPMSRSQATVLRAVAIGHQQAVAADRSYTSCHNRGWLTWATRGDDAKFRREVTPQGWQALIAHHRRENVALRLPVRALVPGHTVRLADRRSEANDAVRVARVTPVTTTSGSLGYLVLADGPPGSQPAPYPDRRPLPPTTKIEVIDYQ